ncbi:MAG TPA: galactitol-1-phosphate 5-dehydrogenase [Atribacteraceae bacterium]|nr:galactitol-1-phosphate 5-dehydrogenase [Atribacteraceae bacterium]
MTAPLLMKALVLESPGSLVFREVTIPELGKGEVLVQVQACGICGSDVSRVFGGEAYRYPLIPGHEFSGEIVDTRDPAHRAWLGKRVTVYPLIPCRRCPQCEAARYELCDQYGYLGSRRDGGFAEYVAAPVLNCIELPETLDYDTGALSEPAAVTWHALKRSMMCPGDRVVVFGLGPIGLLFGYWARLAGCSRLIGVDIETGKFSLAASLGFDELLAPEDGRLSSRLSSLAEEGGVGLVAEASGVGAALKEALRVVAKRGNVLLLGNQGKEVLLLPDDFSRILRKEIRLHGTWNSSHSRLESDWREILDAQSNRKVFLSPIISHCIPLQEGVQVFSDMYNRSFSYSKVILTP